MKLVIDLGSTTTKAALFDGETLVRGQVGDQLLPLIKDQKIDEALIAGKESSKRRELMTFLTAQGCRCSALEVADYDRLSTEETRGLLQPDKIANIFGALYHFPLNDCVIVDLGSVARFDYVTRQGVYLGGAVFKSELLDFGGEPPAALGKTNVDQGRSGCYFGLLGAVERIVAELRLSSSNPGSVPGDVMVVATGGATHSIALKTGLQDFVDKIDPHLVLVGLNQILKERG